MALNSCVQIAIAGVVMYILNIIGSHNMQAYNYIVAINSQNKVEATIH